ncbi:MAG TPA: hypothetical protein VLA62_08025, partial [Solirubrobacterales bacterium]|nr:hypothetical protein [Solirubrobacterales bacterium]
MLPDEAAERLEPQLQVRPEAGQRPGIHALGLGRAQERLQIALDGLPRELVPDPAREVPDLEEVEEPVQADAAAALADRELKLGGVALEQELGQRVDVERRLGEQPIEGGPGPGVLAPERPGRLVAQRRQVEEVEVEETLEGGEVARLLDQGRGQRGPEDVAVREVYLGSGLERVQRLGRRDTELRAPQVADELQDPRVQRAPGLSQIVAGRQPSLVEQERPAGGADEPLLAELTQDPRRRGPRGACQRGYLGLPGRRI